MKIYSVRLYSAVGRKKTSLHCLTIEDALQVAREMQPAWDDPWLSVEPVGEEYLAWEEDSDWFPQRIAIYEHEIYGQDPVKKVIRWLDDEIERVKHTSHADGIGMGCLAVEEILTDIRHRLKPCDTDPEKHVM